MVLLLLTSILSGCQAAIQSPEVLAPEAESVDASTVIKYNTAEDFEGERTLVVSSLNVPFKDKIYTFSLNGPVNYASSNAYFYAGDTYVELTDQAQECGVYESENLVEAVQKIDEDVYVRLKGRDLESVKKILSSIYVSDDVTYRMFDHNISEDWTNEVVITDQVVSFSNGEDTVYVYHNEGSPDGPTIFYKQLDNIDIPITYPEEGFGFNYIPYGFTEYDHLTVEGYTPYSAYDFGIVEPILQEKTPLSQMDTYKKDAVEYGSAYIILAKDDETVYSLFEKKTEVRTAGSLQVTFDTARLEESTLSEQEPFDLSSVTEYASDVIGSDNRYHTQLLLEDGKDVEVTFTSTRTGKYIRYIDGLRDFMTETLVEVSGDYYVDGQEGYIAPPQNSYIEDQLENGYVNPGMPGTVTETIYGGMDGKLIIPTLKLIRPTYRDVTSTMTGGSFRPYNFGESLEEQFVGVTVKGKDTYNYLSTEIGGHGHSYSREEYLKYKGFLWYTDFGIREAINVGDYVYLRKEKQLYIYKCERNEPSEWASQSIDYYINGLKDQNLFYDLYTRSCYVENLIINGEEARYPAIMNAYSLVSVINLK